VKRSKPLRRGRRIAPVSARRAARDEEYEAARYRVAARARGLCEFRGPQGNRCRQPMTDVHHLAGRGGPIPHRMSNLVGMCRNHHEMVHRYPAWSYEEGWMVRRNTNNQEERHDDDTT